MATHYERLGVSPDADQHTIWRAYLSAVRQTLTRHDNARQSLATLDEAWETLRHPDTRLEYDRSIGLAESPAPARDEREEIREEIMDLLTTLAETGQLPGDEGEHEPDEPRAGVDAHAGAEAGAERDGEAEPAGHGPEPEPEPAEAAAEPEPTTASPAGPDEPPASDEPASDEPASDEPASGEPPASDERASDEPPATSRRSHRRADRRAQRRKRRRRPKARPGPVVGRRGSVLTVVLWLVACAAIGAAAGWAAQQALHPQVAFAEGGCVALTGTDAQPVSCDSPSADAQITAVESSPDVCDDVELGWVELPVGAGCLAPLDSDPPG